MNKQEWLKISASTEIPIKVFHTFYLEHNGYVKDLKTFEDIFSQLMGKAMILNNGRQVMINYEVIIHKVFNYYNKKFDIYA